MMSRKVLIAFVATILLTSTTAAISLTANPDYLIVPIGGSNTTILNATTEIDTTDSGINMINYNICGGNVTVTLEGPYINEDCTAPFGEVKTGDSISWNGPPRSYYFKANVSIKENAVAGEKFCIAFSFMSSDYSETSEVMGICTHGEIVPELLTLALAGIGIAIVGIAIRR